MDSVHDTGRGGGLGGLSGLRQEFYRSLTARADALFELTDAVLCAEGPVSTWVGLSLVAEHRCGHGGLYDGLAAGRVDVARLRRTLAGLPVPRAWFTTRRNPFADCRCRSVGGAHDRVDANSSVLAPVDPSAVNALVGVDTSPWYWWRSSAPVATTRTAPTPGVTLW